MCLKEKDAMLLGMKSFKLVLACQQRGLTAFTPVSATEGSSPTKIMGRQGVSKRQAEK